eukprot:TRINITY_DN1854_c0_g1_i2.p2 TRINITY_DN1854_c0_g1~~TRINITY_DN1854_c0_g1_i2.p2  ORF type:complete len:141 (-),score=66.36 TRINITY_DN1854_c0_g1_i2:8-430(-)
MGINRSPTVVIGYLMQFEGMTLQCAYKHVLQRRGSISPHEEYFAQLQKLDQQLHGVVSFTEEMRGGSLQDKIRFMVKEAKDKDKKQESDDGGIAKEKESKQDKKERKLLEKARKEKERQAKHEEKERQNRERKKSKKKPK